MPAGFTGRSCPAPPETVLVDDAVEVVVDAVESASGHRRVVLVDGPSGAGKTTLAARMVEARPSWQVVHADDLHEGWFGLDRAWRLDWLWSATPAYRRWDWDLHRWGGTVEVDPSRPVVVEGCGVVTPGQARRATLSLWCHLDPGRARQRALSREPQFAQWWAAWAVQQEWHRVRHHPDRCADVVVDCSLTPAGT